MLQHYYIVFLKAIMKWDKVQTKGDIPPGVAAHSSVVLGKNIYIFGGMTADGASNSMYRFNTGTLLHLTALCYNAS